MEAETSSGLGNGEHVGIRWRVAHRARIPGETGEDKGLTYYINRSKMSASGSVVSETQMPRQCYEHSEA